MTAIEKVLKFCDDALAFYLEKPATNDYQLGYEAALEQIRELATIAKDKENDCS